MITNQSGLCLTVFTADCIPVLLYDPTAHCIAAVHSGWRGTALAIASRAAEQMTRHYGCDPANLLAAIGPGICQRCFETHSDVPDAMTSALGSDAAPFLHRLDNGKYQVDLKGIIVRCLLRSGLRPEHIALSRHCTACLPEQYWSHRLLGGRRGSMAAMIQLL
jgi:YfiH family protein